MMKILKSSLLLLAFVLFVANPVHAADMRDNLVPPEDKEQIGDVELEYNKYPHSRYSMDTKVPEDEFSDLWNWDEAASKSMWQMLSSMNSFLWQIASLIGLWTGQIVEWAFTLELADLLIVYADNLVSSITGITENGIGSQGVFPILARYFFLALAVWMAYQSLVKKNTTLALGGLIKTAFLIAITITYVLNLGPILTAINNGSSWISSGILAQASSVSDSDNNYSGEEGYANMRNAIFQTMNRQPWLLASFGTTDEKEIQSEYKKDGDRIHDLLKTKDFTKERMKQVEYEVEEQENVNMQPQNLIFRFGFLCFTILTNGAMGMILILMSGSAIFFSFLAIIFSIIGPFALLISLFPGYASNAITWFNKLIHPFLVKIGLCLLMTILFTMQSVIHDNLNGQYGYFGNMILYLIFTIGLWFSRHEILNVITRPTRSSGVNNNAYQNTSEYKNTYNKFKGHASKVTRPFTKKATPQNQKWYNKIKYNPGVGASERNWRAYTPQNAKGSHSNVKQVNVDRSNEGKENVTSSAKDTKTNKSVANAQTTNRTKTDQHPPEPTKEDLNSLDRTTKKGGWGYRAVDKSAPAPKESNAKDTQPSKKAGDFRVVQKPNKVEIPDHVVERRTGGKSNE